MIWNAINYVLHIVAAIRLTFMGKLPSSPIYLDSTTQTNLASIVAHTAWFFPVHAMVQELGAVAAVVSLLMILYVIWKIYGVIGLIGA